MPAGSTADDNWRGFGDRLRRSRDSRYANTARGHGRRKVAKRVFVSYRCGQRAASFLAEVKGGSAIRCDAQGSDQYGRTLVQCMLGDVDLGEAMVEAGWAVAFLRYSNQYVGAERSVSLKRRGMWNGQFVRPTQYRAAKRR